MPDYDSDATITFPYTNTNGFATGSEGNGHLYLKNTTFDKLSTLYQGGTPVTVAVTYTLDSALSATAGTLTLKTNPSFDESVVTIANEKVSAAGSYSFDLDNETASLLTTYGMAISGTNIRITSVKYAAVELNLGLFTGTIPATAVAQTDLYKNPVYTTDDNKVTIGTGIACSWTLLRHANAKVGDTVYITIVTGSTSGQFGMKNGSWSDITSYTNTTVNSTQIVKFNVTMDAYNNGFGACFDGVTVTGYAVDPEAAK